jgi:hypothetical protein
LVKEELKGRDEIRGERSEAVAIVVEKLLAIKFKHFRFPFAWE